MCDGVARSTGKTLRLLQNKSSTTASLNVAGVFANNKSVNELFNCSVFRYIHGCPESGLGLVDQHINGSLLSPNIVTTGVGYRCLQYLILGRNTHISYEAAVSGFQFCRNNDGTRCLFEQSRSGYAPPIEAVKGRCHWCVLRIGKNK